MKGINKNQFEEAVKNNEIVIVDFFASWCGPCQMYYPVFSKVSAEHGNPKIKMVAVDVDQEQELAMKYHVESIPTTVVIKNGQVIDGFRGYRTESQLQGWVRNIK